ncbi:MAG: DUF927 domain-containing protein [Anaerolineales bacterium]|nr:DUF927 domain-containing protein [Anaerolineales bacterium]
MGSNQTAARPAGQGGALVVEDAGRVSSYLKYTTGLGEDQGVVHTDGPVREIKSRLDLAEFIVRDIPLRKSGPRWVGLCPFHSDHDPSLVVFPDGGWRCFGCGAGGDVFDYVMLRQGWDFRTALKELARDAGVELTPLTPEQQKAEAERRGYEAALELAPDHFAQRLRDTSAALEYARGRAWPDEAITAERIGYADGSPLPSLGNDRAQAVASALNRWAGGQGGAIVYAHRDAGRVAYLSGRAVAHKAHWNPPANLAGPKRPYLNACYGPRVSELVVVEGQADAVSLAGWSIPALALAGATPTGDLAAHLKRHAEQGCTIYLAPDGDGRTDVAGIVEAVGPLLAVVRLPDGVADTNAYAQGGATDADFRALLEDAPTWLTQEIARVASVNGRERTGARHELFERLARLDPFVLDEYRGAVTEALHISVAQFNRLLRAVEAEAVDERRNGHGDERYTVEGGRLCCIKFSPNGERYAQPLCNFTANVAEDVAHDNGEDVTREFEVTGTLDDGQRLPAVRVDASKFTAMGWVSDLWGVGAVVRAGLSTRDQLREAIQLRSAQAERRYVYTHTGWREIDGQRVFLHAGGAIGLSGVSVELDREVERYRLPSEPTDVVEAMRASLRFLEVAPDAVTVPLWAAMYLAPLAEIIYPDFVLWLYGVTGTLKSTLAALALCHYGEFDGKSLPASWTDTANRLEMTAFLAKDVPIVVDDFAPQSDPYRAREMEQTATRLVRGIGNRNARRRLRSDLSLRPTYRPRSLVISTGEQVPDGQSIIARVYTVEMQPGDVDLGRLTVAQAEAARYPHAASGYLQWLAGQWGHLSATLPGEWLSVRARILAETRGQHLRIPEVLASMWIGLDIGLSFSVEMGALTEEQAQVWRDRGWAALKARARLQAERVEHERPTARFFEILGTLLDQGRVRLDELRGTGCVGGGEPIGWHDENRVYLLPGAYNSVARYLRDEGGHFPVKERALYKALVEEGYLQRMEAGRYTDRLWDGERSHRVLWLDRDRLSTHIEILAPAPAVMEAVQEGIPF